MTFSSGKRNVAASSAKRLRLFDPPDAVERPRTEREKM